MQMNRSLKWRSRARLLLALIPAALVVMIGSAQQQGGQEQSNQQQGARGQGPAGFSSNFTGKITVADNADVRTSRIRFEAGARTNWHVHTAGQLILAEEGRGRFQEQGGAIKEMGVGQPAYLQANVPHWHGATPDQAILQLSMYAGQLKWMQPVTDEEYLGKKR